MPERVCCTQTRGLDRRNQTYDSIAQHVATVFTKWGVATRSAVSALRDAGEQDRMQCKPSGRGMMRGASNITVCSAMLRIAEAFKQNASWLSCAGALKTFSKAAVDDKNG